MVSNNSNQEFVWCNEHNQMIHRDNAKLLMQAASEREQNEQEVVQQLDTMIAFMSSSSSPVPSYLPRKDNNNIKQAGFSDKPNPKNNSILPTMTENFLQFGGMI